MMILGVLNQEPSLSTVVNYLFNEADYSTTTTDSTGNTTATGLQLPVSGHFAYIFDGGLYRYLRAVTIDNSGSLSPYLTFESDFEITVKIKSESWAYDYAISVFQLLNSMDAVVYEVTVAVTGIISTYSATGLPNDSANVGVNLSSFKEIKLIRVGSTMSVYYDGAKAFDVSASGTITAGRLMLLGTAEVTLIDYITVKKV